MRAGGPDLLPRLLAAFAAILLAHGLCCSHAGPSKPAVLCLCVERNDQIQGKSSCEILPLGEWDSRRWLDLDEANELPSSSPRRLVLERENRFEVFFRGRSLGPVSPSRIEMKSYECSELNVGVAEAVTIAFPAATADAGRAWSGFDGDQDESYGIRFLLALSSGSPAARRQPHGQMASEDLSPSRRRDLRAAAVPLLLRRNANLDPEKVGLSEVCAWTPPGREAPLLIFTLHGDTEEECESLAMVAEFSQGKLAPLWSMPHQESTDSWGQGYQFIDALDLDGDGVMELMFQVGYYEATGFEVYKLKDGKLEKVFETIPWGC